MSEPAVFLNAFAQALALSEVAALAWVGLGLQNRYLVVAFHMAVAMPTGTLPSRTARHVVTAAYVVAIVVASAYMLFEYYVGDFARE